MLSSNELNNILQIIERQIVAFVGTSLGPEMLSNEDKKVLRDSGIDLDRVYDESKDLVQLNFQLGLLSGILKESQTKSFTYDSLIKYIQSGNYIPLNATEKAIIQSIKNQSLQDIRESQGRIFRDINNVVQQQFANARQNQEEFIREKIKEGVEARKSRKEIAREIAKLTGDWQRDFRKSVAYISHTAFNEGRAAIIEKKSGGESKVWFRVQGDACVNCKRLFLKKGTDEPIVFKLSEIVSNGSNIGRKQADWVPCVCVHPHCRCTIQEYLPGTVWENGRWVFRKEEKPEQRSVKRPLIRVYINGKEAWV